MISYDKKYDEFQVTPWRFQVIRDGEVIYSEGYNGIADGAAFINFKTRMDVLRNHFIDDYQEEHGIDIHDWDDATQ